MSTQDKLSARLKATLSLGKLYETAQECRSLYAKAGLPVPKEVELLINWGQDEAKAEANAKRPTLHAIQPPFPPMERGWLSVDIAKAQPITVVPALLRDAGQLKLPDLLQKLQALGIDAPEGSIMNIGTKLDRSGVIERSLDGWALSAPDRAAMLSGGRLHGPKEVFQDSEKAAHRREAILSYLQEYGRLTRSQIIGLLEQSDWVLATVNVFLVKTDLLVLKAEKKIRRVQSDNPRSWEWELVKKKGQLRLASAV